MAAFDQWIAFPEDHLNENGDVYARETFYSFGAGSKGIDNIYTHALICHAGVDPGTINIIHSHADVTYDT